MATHNSPPTPWSLPGNDFLRKQIHITPRAKRSQHGLPGWLRVGVVLAGWGAGVALAGWGAGVALAKIYLLWLSYFASVNKVTIVREY